MTRRTDAIVVGAGLGGLSAAAHLAKAGLSVRVFERHTQPGGYATTFVRGRFEFEVSLHAMSGYGFGGRRGPVRQVFEELGIDDRLSFLPIAPLYRTLAPGLDLCVPPGMGAAEETLCATFPHQKDGFASLFRRLRDIWRELAEMNQRGDTAPSPADAIRRYPNVAHAAMIPLGVVLERELTDPLAKLAFCQLWGYYGLPPSAVSYVLFMAGQASYLTFGGAYPRGKSQAISNAFVSAIEDAGGEVVLGRGVARILCRDGRVTGVALDDGEAFEADHVVSNASPPATCADLLDPDDVPRSFRNLVASGKTSLGSVCVYVGLNRDHRALGLEQHEVFFNDSADTDAHYRSYLEVGTPEAFLLASYNATVPEFSPPGTCVAVLVSLADGAAWSRLDPARYHEAKEQIADSMLARAERQFPGLRAAIEEVVVSTPLTNMRYTGNPGGAIYGYSNTPAWNPAWRIDNRGPIPGLWFVGAWAQPGGGYEPCITSGRVAAQRIVRGIEKAAAAAAAGGAS